MSKLFSIKIQSYYDIKYIVYLCILGIKIKFNIKNLFSKKPKIDINRYKIIPLGNFCMPRIITTIAKLKPRKKQGEKTCPFDLAFFYDINEITKLISTKFRDFFDDIEYSDGNWVNNKINAKFNHEKNPDKNIFIELYQKRIDNMYNYLSNEKNVICIYSVLYETPNSDEIKNLLNSVKLHRPDKKTTLVVLNHSNQEITLKENDIYIINNLSIDEINKNDGWVEELRIATDNAKILYNKIIPPLREIIYENIN